MSLNGPTGWDVAGGHALLIGAGGDLFNQAGEVVRYDSTGMPQGAAISTCFGGTRELAKPYIGKSWRGVMQASSQAAAQSLSFLAPGQLIEDPLVLGRAQGCLLGQLAGDALGSLGEFSSPEQTAHRYPKGPSLLEEGGTWSTIAGQPTDDSELALVLARSIVQAGDYDAENAAAAYARWKQSAPFDIGNTTRTALSAAASALQSKGSAAAAAMMVANRGSQANGALMRISPLAIFASPLDAEVLMDMARQDAKLTHPNEVCQDANAIFAATVGFAIRSGSSKSEVYDYAVKLAGSGAFSESVVSRLREAEKHPPNDFTSQMGWVLIAFQNAFFRLLHAESVKDGVVETVCGRAVIRTPMRLRVPCSARYMGAMRFRSSGSIAFWPAVRSVVWTM